MKQNSKTRKIILWVILATVIISVAGFVIGFNSYMGSSASEQMKTDNPAIQIYHIRTSFAEAYLVKDEKLVLIETGLPDKQDMLIKEIRALGFKPEDIALAIVTHGHADHAGNAKFLQDTYHIPVVGGEGDLVKFQSGITDLEKTQKSGLMAYLISPISNINFTPFTPDIVVHEKMDLAEYGLPGSIQLAPGHTPGSVVVIVDKYLFAGDLFRGDGKGHPTVHWFQEDPAEANATFKQLLADNPQVKIVIPTHNGALIPADEIEAYLNR